LPSKQLTNTGFPFRAYSCFGEKQEREEKGMEKIEKEKKYFSAPSSVEEIGPLLREGVPKYISRKEKGGRREGEGSEKGVRGREREREGLTSIWVKLAQARN
jgi:hypothetical protein